MNTNDLVASIVDGIQTFLFRWVLLFCREVFYARKIGNKDAGTHATVVVLEVVLLL
jgi:hypothetical protein